MQLISLNTWGGYLKPKLLTFLNAHQDIDIFCFQEVYHRAPKLITAEDRAVDLNGFDTLARALPGHTGYFSPAVQGIYGLAIFVKHGIQAEPLPPARIYESDCYDGKLPNHDRYLQTLKCWVDDEDFYVINMHGLWNGRGKTDCPERISQSERARGYFDTLSGKRIICGDFNLRPDTESFSILAQDLQDMIAEHDIRSTRTRFYPKTERMADYVLLSPEVEAEHFSVLTEEVSDHAALMCEFH